MRRTNQNIPLRRFHEAAAVMRGLGAHVETQIYPGEGHGIMAPDMATQRGWLQG